LFKYLTGQIERKLKLKSALKLEKKIAGDYLTCAIFANDLESVEYFHKLGVKITNAHISMAIQHCHTNVLKYLVENTTPEEIKKCKISTITVCNEFDIEFFNYMYYKMKALPFKLLDEIVLNNIEVLQHILNPETDFAFSIQGLAKIVCTRCQYIKYDTLVRIVDYLIAHGIPKQDITFGAGYICAAIDQTDVKKFHYLMKYMNLPKDKPLKPDFKHTNNQDSKLRPKNTQVLDRACFETTTGDRYNPYNYDTDDFEVNSKYYADSKILKYFVDLGAMFDMKPYEPTECSLDVLNYLKSIMPYVRVKK
jgi:hypothetical protein